MVDDDAVLRATVRLREMQRSNGDVALVLAAVMQREGCVDLIELAKKMPGDIVALAEQLVDVEEQMEAFDRLLEEGELR